MTSVVSLAYDFLFLSLFAYAAVCSWKKGFLASLTELIGAVLGVAAAVWASNTLAPPLYERFLSGSISERVESAVQQSGGDLAAAVQGMDFLPETVQQALADLLQNAGGALPEQVTDALEPLLLPFVQAVLFVVFCMVVRWAFRLLVGLLRQVNHVPLIGSVNRLLGLALGLITGALDCWLFAMLLWFVAGVTADKLEVLTLPILQQSVGYRFFGAFNPFLTHY